MSIEANLQFQTLTVYDASMKKQFQEKEDREQTAKKVVAEEGKSTTEKNALENGGQYKLYGMQLKKFLYSTSHGIYFLAQFHYDKLIHYTFSKCLANSKGNGFVLTGVFFP